MSLRKTLVIGISSISTLLLIWMTGAFYLAIQSQNLVYEVDKSKNSVYPVPVETTYLKLNNGTKIEVLTAKAKNEKVKKNIIVYLHGNIGRIPKLLGDLTNYGSVVSPSYPGFSGSEGKPTTTNIYETAKITINWLESNGVAESDITILGHSLGGSTAVYAATQFPKVKELVLVNTFFSIQRECERSYSILCVLAGNIHNSGAVAQNIDKNTPVRFFHNVNDEKIPHSEGEKLFNVIPSTNKQFLNISGTHGEFDPGEIFK